MAGDLDKAIRECLPTVTPGPWRCFNGWQLGDGSMAFERIGPESGGGITPMRGGDIYASRADAEFVALAREWVPALLAALDAYRTAISEIGGAAAEALADEGVADWAEGGRLGDALIGIKDCAETALRSDR